VAHTLMKVSIAMMRPNRKGNRGARMAMSMKNPKNIDHGWLLRRCEGTQDTESRYGDGLI